ncbi:MAG: hypothetical protein AAF570_21100, partial [Bacteroidota bacterium]
KMEVLSDESAIAERFERLREACTLGNLYKGKVKIRFMTEEGPHEVFTTIWNVSERYIGLKNGADIPIHAIFGVER